MTPAIMAPEIIRGTPATVSSDLYAVGVLLYELLTGDLPSRGSGSLLRSHRLGLSFAKPAQEVRAELPDQLCDIITRSLEPDPTDRYQTAGEMGYDLEYFLYHGGFGPTNVTLGEYLKRRLPESPVPSGRRAEGRTTQVPTRQLVEQRAETVFGELLEQRPEESSEG